jgi:hypothetical protein
MRRWLDEIDLHIVWMVAPFALFGCVAPRGLILLLWLVGGAVIPQGRILTRAFVDYPQFGERPWPYLVVNECLLLVLCGLPWLIGFVVLWLRGHPGIGG